MSSRGRQRVQLKSPSLRADSCRLSPLRADSPFNGTIVSGWARRPAKSATQGFAPPLVRSCRLSPLPFNGTIVSGWARRPAKSATRVALVAGQFALQIVSGWARRPATNATRVVLVAGQFALRWHDRFRLGPTAGNECNSSRFSPPWSGRSG